MEKTWKWKRYFVNEGNNPQYVDCTRVSIDKGYLIFWETREAGYKSKFEDLVIIKFPLNECLYFDDLSELDVKINLKGYDYYNKITNT